MGDEKAEGMRHARDGWLGPDGTWHAGEPPRGWRISRDGRWRPTLAAPMRAPRYVPPPLAQAVERTFIQTDHYPTTAGLMRRANPHRHDRTQAGPVDAAATHAGDTGGTNPWQDAARGGAPFWPEEPDHPGDAAEGDDEPRHLGNTGMTQRVLPPGLRGVADRAIAGLRSTTVRTRIGAGMAAVVLLVGLIAATIAVLGSGGGEAPEFAGSPSSSESAASPTASPDGGTFLDDLATTDTTSASTTTTASEPTTTTEPTTSTSETTRETHSTEPPRSSDRPPAPERTPETTEPRAPEGPEVYYRNCGEVRRRGIDGLRPGDPGYRPGLDHNSSGVACARE